MNRELKKSRALFAALSLSLVFGVKGLAQSPDGDAAGRTAAGGPPEVAVEAEAAAANTTLATNIEPPRIELPPALAEVVRLAQSGLSDEVVLTYIQKSTGALSVNADQILYLRDLGLSSKVIEAVVAQGPSLSVQGVAAPAPDTYPAPPPETSVDPSYFYKSLSPYGSWLDVPGYGRVWQPAVAVVNPNWQPYSNDGYWQWTDAGWYWNSSYSWGWAPFHYGRWSRHARYGWLWHPDRTWAPAWVSWRSSGNFHGWAPLPPGAHFAANTGWSFHGRPVGHNFGFGLGASAFTFVSLDRFSDRRVSSHRLGAREAGAAFHSATVNNNFVAGAGNRIFNRGIDSQRVQTATRAPVPQVAVRDIMAGRRNVRTSDRASSPSGVSGAVVQARSGQPTSAGMNVVPRGSRPEQSVVRANGNGRGRAAVPAASIGNSIPSRSASERPAIRGTSPSVSAPRARQVPVAPVQTRPAPTPPASTAPRNQEVPRGNPPRQLAIVPGYSSAPRLVESVPSGRSSAIRQAAPTRPAQRSAAPSPSFRSSAPRSPSVASRPAASRPAPSVSAGRGSGAGSRSGSRGEGR